MSEVKKPYSQEQMLMEAAKMRESGVAVSDAEADPEVAQDKQRHETAEQPAHKSITVEFKDGTSLEIPYSEKRVNFPAHLRQETGVQGYDRKEVSFTDYDEALNTIVPLADIQKLRLLLIDLESYVIAEIRDDDPEAENRREYQKKNRPIYEAERQKTLSCSKINSPENLSNVHQMIEYGLFMLAGIEKAKNLATQEDSDHRSSGYGHQLPAELREKLLQEINSLQGIYYFFRITS